MNQHVRKTKGVTADHPVPVLDDSFLFDLDERRNGDKRPYNIDQIEPDTADFSSSGVRRHISGSQHDKKYGHKINVAVYTMEPTAFFKNVSRKVE